MDSARIGKALGIGTRVLSKAVVKSLEQSANQKAEQIRTVAEQATKIAAAATEQINAAKQQVDVAKQQTAAVAQKAAAATSMAATATSKAATATKKAATTAPRQAKRFGEALWGPFVHTSGIVWLEVMGLLFAFVALYFGQSLWKHSADLSQPFTSKLFQQYLLYIAATGLFIYFAISSFVRAELKARRKR